MQERIKFHLQSCISRGKAPDWMTTGRTVLLLKDRSEENVVSNYRLVTCLSLIWKLLTDIIAERYVNNLDKNDLLPEEQKGCRRNSRCKKDQLLIDKAITKNHRNRNVGLNMVWIDYLKVYDMVPHSWIKKSIEMCGVFFKSGNEELARVIIQREIFQGDTLYSLLSVISLIHLVHTLRTVNAGY